MFRGSRFKGINIDVEYLPYLSFTNEIVTTINKIGNAQYINCYKKGSFL